jgi:hypothetical protein
LASARSSPMKAARSLPGTAQAFAARRRLAGARATERPSRASTEAHRVAVSSRTRAFSSTASSAPISNASASAAVRLRPVALELLAMVGGLLSLGRLTFDGLPDDCFASPAREQALRACVRMVSSSRSRRIRAPARACFPVKDARDSLRSGGGRRRSLRSCAKSLADTPSHTARTA